MDEDDHEVECGQWGEICIAGPGVMQGYWGKPEESARALRNGWLHSGDIGTMDDEGYVAIVDRVKDMINVAGFKVWPAEVEHVLYRHPAVREAAVYGVGDLVKGEAVRHRHRRGDHRLLPRIDGGLQGSGRGGLHARAAEERDRQDPQTRPAREVTRPASP